MAAEAPAPPAETERISATTPFRYPVFRNIWIANLASRLGGLIQATAASWTMASITTSAVMVSLVQASTTLPIMLFALLAGALADTFDRRRIMIAAQVFMLLVSAALATCAFLGLISPWLLLLFTFLIGCGNAMNGPAWQASVGEMVPRPAVPPAVALNSVAFNVSRSIGPAIGGLILAAAGAAAAFAVNAASYVGLLVVLARWRPAAEGRTLPREPLPAAMLAGIRYASMSPQIVTVLLRGSIFGLGASAVPALMPLVARDLVTGGALTYGLLLGAFGVGAVTGGLGSTSLRRRLPNEMLVRVASVAFALAAVVVAASRALPLTMAALAVAGAGWVLVLSMLNVTVQMSAPRWVVGRALALYQSASFGGMAVGSWLWGGVTEQVGLSLALIASTVALLTCAALGFRFPLPQAEALNLDPLRQWKEPELALEIEPRSGPIVVAIEYRIRPEDIGAFLTVMAERRRVRRRDGARHWSLLRDLEDPDLWVERYHSPTWTDYVRHNQRITHADAEVGARLRELHQGPETPHVRRMIERRPDASAAGDESHARDPVEPLTDPAGQS